MYDDEDMNACLPACFRFGWEERKKRKKIILQTGDFLTDQPFCWFFIYTTNSSCVRITCRIYTKFPREKTHMKKKINELMKKKFRASVYRHSVDPSMTFIKPTAQPGCGCKL